MCVPQVSKQFGTMPFNLRSMDDEKKVNLFCSTIFFMFRFNNPNSSIDMDTLELRRVSSWSARCMLVLTDFHYPTTNIFPGDPPPSQQCTFAFFAQAVLR